MEQNSTKILKFSGFVFLGLFVVSLIFFFIPKAGKLKGIEYSKAIIKAKETGKGLFITTFSRWDKKMKLSSNILFTNKNIKQLIDSNFITVIMDLDNNKNDKIIKDYELSGNFSILTDKYGSPVTYLFNTNTAFEFEILLKEAINLPFFEWSNFKEAQVKSSENNKPIICFFTSYINDNLRLAEYLKINNNLDYLNMNFNPVLVYTKFPPNYELARQILGFDDELIKSVEVSMQSKKSNNIMNFSNYGDIKVTILDKDAIKIAQSQINSDVMNNGNFQEFIENTLKGEKK